MFIVFGVIILSLSYALLFFIEGRDKNNLFLILLSLLK